LPADLRFRYPSGGLRRPPTGKGGPTTARRGATTIVLALVLAAGVVVVPAALADTRSQLEAAKADYTRAQADLAAATQAWQLAEAQLASLNDQIDTTRARIAQRESTIARLESRLQDRAVGAFESGIGGTLDILLSSASITEFSDRVEYLGSIAQGDSDLVVGLEVEQEQLRRDRDSLSTAIDRQAQIAVQREQARSAIAGAVARLADDVATLEDKLKREQRALTFFGQSANPGAPIALCPVRGPTSFVDSFGWPRPGGRTHEGIDMIAPYGTPVVAVQPGRAAATPNTLGGNAVIVYGPGGDWTYYAHLSSYGQLGSVAVGTVVGYVGATGDTDVNHLHFEYHPGGGGAVDPYNALRAVC
jgi:murein DD-endopeptidase MepM/ murein hydrolase activator NlpD